MTLFEARNSLILKKMGELLKILEENNRTESFEFFKVKEKYSDYQINFYRIKCSNRSLEVRLYENGKLLVVYKKDTNKADRKHIYELTGYEINAVSGVLNKLIEDFENNVVSL